MKKLIFINNPIYFETLKNELETNFELLWFETINDFHHVLTDKSNITAIIICESYPSYISSIRSNLVLARYYEYRDPILILSFLPFKYINENVDYNLNALILNKSDLYLQLPISNDELISTISNAIPLNESMNPSQLPYVMANKLVIDHIVNRPINTKITYTSSQNNKIQADMSNPIIHKILLVEDNSKDVQITIKNFQRFKEDTELDFIFEIIPVGRGDLVENLLIKEMDIQSVLLDWLLLEGTGAIQSISQDNLIKVIKGIRPELPIYIFTSSKDPYDIVDVCNLSISSYFSKDQFFTDPISVFKKIISDYNYRRSSPFWEAYRNYVDESNDSWHTPGHARGTSFRKSPYLQEFYKYFGANTFAADLSVSVESLGSLLDSTLFVKKAQEKTAKTFGSKKVFFATNGSSTSNKIIIQTMLRPGDGVIIDRNCHKSVHYGIIQAGLGHVTYLNSEFSEKYRIFAPPSKDEIKTKITEAKQKCLEKGIALKAIIITGCTYDGMLIDVEEIVKIAHDNGLKIFIDEAWFAYSGFHPDLRKYSAIYSGADYVTHSAHKVLSAFSQASIIHINDPHFNESYFREIFYIYTSTSPQYHMIASLDVAAMQMEMEGFKKLNEAIEMANGFRDRLSKLSKIEVLSLDHFKNEFKHLGSDDVGHDPLKVLLDISKLNYKVEDIHKYLFEEGGLEIEKDTTTTILVLFTIGSSQDKVARLYLALKNLDEGTVDIKKRNDDTTSNKIKLASFPKLELLGKPSDAFFSKKREERSLKELEELVVNVELISINLVTPYPPGIPLLVPNQKITVAHINVINKLLDEGVSIHGCHENKIWVALGKDIN
jgi:arginine decarboxylase